ncbi:hypothetical protein BGX29_007119 [Mortierella sp. GBA35]|nr:hypothetical protein BGX29_007119 [Mortierella sp. GBA35]
MYGPRPEDALLLPELIERLGPFLAPPDLFSSIKVCRLWCQILTPYLWATLDDCMYQWPRILCSDMDNKKGEDKDKDENKKDGSGEWLQAMMDKHGRHIRHLRICWRSFLDAVTLAPTCYKLESLSIGDLSYSLKRSTAEEYPWVAELEFRERRRTIEEYRRLAVRGPFIWPEQTEGVYSAETFTANNVYSRTLAQQELDWLTTQRFWLFLRSNTGIRRLRLHYSLNGVLDLVAPEFFYETMALFEGLVYFDNNYMPVNLDRLFSRLPRLRHFRRTLNIRYDNIDVFLQQDHPQLVYLELGAELTIRTFYNLIRHLPSIDRLRLGGFRYVQNECTPEEAAELMDNRPSRLRRLQINGSMHVSSTRIITALAWVPELTHFMANQVYPGTAVALASYCKKLVVVCEAGGRESFSWRTRRPEAGSVRYLLEQCPTLKSFDGPGQMVNINTITFPSFNNTAVTLNVDDGLDEARRPWIGGFDRLTGPEQELYDKISAPRYTARVPRKRHLAVTLKNEACIAQQEQLYDRLARLTCLTVLDLGHDINMARPFATPISSISNEAYTSDYGPLLGTLELTLESGLDRLTALECLEVFGFEGVDHRIGRREVEWMALAWPRLRIMRGLHQVSPPRIEYERRKEGLRALMMELRPDVRHEGYKARKNTDPWYDIVEY